MLKLFCNLYQQLLSKKKIVKCLLLFVCFYLPVNMGAQNSGYKEVQLTHNKFDDRYASYNKDGEIIIFESNRDGHWQIYSMDVNGNDQKRIINSTSNDRRPTWHPYKNIILFESDRTGKSEIYKFDLSSKIMLKIPIPLKGNKSFAQFAPNGKELVFNYKVSNFNRAIQSERQPGSNFKPFIYSAALNKGYTLATIINDAPIVQKDTGENELWRPTNDTLKFYGPTPLRVGLIKSRNLVSIRLLQGIGVPYALQYVKRFGFDPNALPHSLSLALGSGSATPLQIAVGYSVFANGGYLVTPYFIRKIIDQYDNVLYTANPASACSACLITDTPKDEELPQNAAPRVITPQNAYLITQAMRDVIQKGTGRAAKVLKRTDIAGKTGTTNRQVDAWFSGFNSNIVTTIWVGFDNMKSLKEYGARAALPIWIQFMREALDNTPEATMPEPPGMVTVRVDPQTGLLASPTSKNPQFEIFRKQYAPHQYNSDIATGANSDGSDGGGNSGEQIF